MSVNREKPHVLVLPEDDANRQIALGFWRATSTRQIQVLAPADGWLKVLECFNRDHAADMRRRPNRHLVLLIDFDQDPARLERAKAQIPSDLQPRTFVVGTFSTPEKLKSSIGRSFEFIGADLAKDCQHQTTATWGHDLLRHNALEVERLNKTVRPILYPASD